MFPDFNVKDNIETVENSNHYNSKDNDNDKTEEELSESGETTSSTTESDVSDVEMDSNSEDPFAWDKQVRRNFTDSIFLGITLFFSARKFFLASPFSSSLKMQTVFQKYLTFIKQDIPSLKCLIS